MSNITHEIHLPYYGEEVVVSGQYILEGTMHLANAAVADTLDTDTLSIEFSTKGLTLPTETYLDTLGFGTPVQYYRNNVLIGEFYIESIKRTSRFNYRLELLSSVGLLTYRTHTGGIYEGTTAGSVIADIMGSLGYIIDDDVAAFQLYGYLPIASARDNLRQVLYCQGASIKKDPTTGLPWFKYNLPEESIVIPDARIFEGGSVEYTAPVTAFTLTEHSYYIDLDAEESILYDNSSTVTSTASIAVNFDGPYHSLRPTGTLVVEESNANYAIVRGVGVLYGKPYVHNTRPVTYYTRANTEQPNEASVTECTLINSLNVENAAARTSKYLGKAVNNKCTFILDGEVTGDLVTFTNGYGESKDGFVTGLDYSIGGNKVKADGTFITDWKPSNVGNYYNAFKIVTAADTVSSTYTVPADIVGKKCSLVLFGAGQAGYPSQEANPAETATPHRYGGIYYFDAASGGRPGVPGNAGLAGKLVKINISQMPSTITSISFGQGVSPTSMDPTVDPPTGGESTIRIDNEIYTTIDGEQLPKGSAYINLINGDKYARSDQDGQEGKYGGSITGGQVTLQASAGNDGEDFGEHSGGLGHDGQYSEHAPYTYYASGVGGGSASADSDGGDSTASTLPTSGAPTMGVSGTGGSVTQPAANTYGSGGKGANAPSGAGAVEAVIRFNSYGYDPTIYTGTQPSVAQGCLGGKSGDGFLLIYYNADLLMFSIDGKTYEADAGMTWRQWLDSDYNIDGYMDDSTRYSYSQHYVYTHDGTKAVKMNNTMVLWEDTLVSNGVYTISALDDEATGNVFRGGSLALPSAIYGYIKWVGGTAHQSSNMAGPTVSNPWRFSFTDIYADDRQYYFYDNDTYGTKAPVDVGYMFSGHAAYTNIVVTTAAGRTVTATALNVDGNTITKTATYSGGTYSFSSPFGINTWTISDGTNTQIVQVTLLSEATTTVDLEAPAEPAVVNITGPTSSATNVKVTISGTAYNAVWTTDKWVATMNASGTATVSADGFTAQTINVIEGQTYNVVLQEVPTTGVIQVNAPATGLNISAINDDTQVVTTLTWTGSGVYSATVTAGTYTVVSVDYTEYSVSVTAGQTTYITWVYGNAVITGPTSSATNVKATLGSVEKNAVYSITSSAWEVYGLKSGTWTISATGFQSGSITVAASIDYSITLQEIVSPTIDTTFLIKEDDWDTSTFTTQPDFGSSGLRWSAINTAAGSLTSPSGYPQSAYMFIPWVPVGNWYVEYSMTFESSGSTSRQAGMEFQFDDGSLDSRKLRGQLLDTNSSAYSAYDAVRDVSTYYSPNTGGTGTAHKAKNVIFRYEWENGYLRVYRNGTLQSTTAYTYTAISGFRLWFSKQSSKQTPTMRYDYLKAGPLS